MKPEELIGRTIIKIKVDTYWQPGVYLKLDNGKVIKFRAHETGIHNERWQCVVLEEGKFPKQIKDQEDD